MTCESALTFYPGRDSWVSVVFFSGKPSKAVPDHRIFTRVLLVIPSANKVIDSAINTTLVNIAEHAISFNLGQADLSALEYTAHIVYFDGSNPHGTPWGDPLLLRGIDTVV